LSTEKVVAEHRIEVFPSTMGNLLLGILLDVLGRLRKSKAWKHLFYWDRGLEMADHKTFRVATDVKLYAN
jgi:hypothetical protein